MKTIGAALLLLLFPAALAAPGYFVTGATLRGHTNPQGPVCVANTVFFPGEMIVFHADIFDAETGELMDADDIAERNVRLTVRLDPGEELSLGFIPHGEPENPDVWYWAAAWEIPADYPTGTITYTLEATDDEGRTGTFTPIEQAASINLLTIVAAGE